MSLSKKSEPSSNLLWREVQRANFTRWNVLADFLELSESQRQEIDPTSSFPLNLPKRLADKIQKGTLDDPILHQFLPQKRENALVKGFGPNPVEEDRFRSEKKLLIKYQGRALLLCTSACAMNCRFCFRRHFPYDHSGAEFSKELEVIRADPTIRELILSGGDPLSLDNRTLDALISASNAIPHLKRLRFHTRFPIGIPERIDAEFLSILAKQRLQTWFVLHCNHPAELDVEVWASIKKLQKLSIPVMTQTVLLKGVNDSVEVLKELCERLVDQGVIPYYLHQLDPVAGAAHFAVDQKRGLALFAGLRDALPGYALPRYVQEVAGLDSKYHIF